MNNGQIFVKTLPFVLFRLLAQTALVSVMGAYAALIFLLITALVGMEVAGLVSLIVVLIFAGLGIGIYRFLSNYIAYMIKSAHVAVITELVEHGAISTNENMISYGIGKVRQRFITTNVFFVLDKLISGAVRQVQTGVSAVASFLDAIPGVRQIAAILNMFIGIVLNYVDEAVLSHIFRSNKDNEWKGAADGIVLYFQNWKEILKNATGIILLLLFWYFVGGVALFFGFSFIFKAIIPVEEIAVYVAIFLAAAIVLIVKAAIIDPWILISIINRYTKVTTGQQPAVDFYEKARKFSTKFRKIEDKAGGPTPSASGAAPLPGPGAAATSANSLNGSTGTVVATGSTAEGPGGVLEHTANTLRKTRFSPIVDLRDPVGTAVHIAQTDLINQGLDYVDNQIDKLQDKQQPAPQAQNQDVQQTPPSQPTPSVGGQYNGE